MTMEGVKQHGGEAVDEEFSIKPQASTPQLDTSNWPLLLKNYDKRSSSLPLLPRCIVSPARLVREDMWC